MSKYLDFNTDIQGVFKNIKPRAVLIKTEMNNEWFIKFLKNSLLDIPHDYSSEFFVGWSTSETFLFIWYEAASFYFNILHIFKSLILVMNFLESHIKQGLVGMLHLHYLVFHLKLLIKIYQGLILTYLDEMLIPLLMFLSKF